MKKFYQDGMKICESTESPANVEKMKLALQRAKIELAYASLRLGNDRAFTRRSVVLAIEEALCSTSE